MPSRSWHMHSQGTPALAYANVSLGLAATGCDDVYSAICSLMIATGVKSPAECAYDQLGIDKSAVRRADLQLAQSFEGDVAIMSTLQIQLAAKSVRYITIRNDPKSYHVKKMLVHCVGLSLDPMICYAWSAPCCLAQPMWRCVILHIL